MRGVEFKDQLVQANEQLDFSLDDKIVGVNIFNQGTNTMLTSIGNGGLFRQTLPGASIEYAVPGTFVKGYLKISFTGAGTSEAVVTTAYDRGEICD